MARTTGSHSDITGPRIRAAASRLFAERGYAAVSMRQIAGEVGVQAGALYNYIPDKQTLLVELMRDHMAHLLETLPENITQGPADRRLMAFVHHHIAYHFARPDEVFIAYMELRNLDADNYAVIEELRARYENVLDEILRQGVADGAMVLRDTRVATFAVIAMLTGVNTWFREGGRLSLSEVQDLYWAMVRRAVGMG